MEMNEVVNTLKQMKRMFSAIEKAEQVANTVFTLEKTIGDIQKKKKETGEEMEALERQFEKANEQHNKNLADLDAKLKAKQRAFQEKLSKFREDASSEREQIAADTDKAKRQFERDMARFDEMVAAKKRELLDLDSELSNKQRIMADVDKRLAGLQKLAG